MPFAAEGLKPMEILIALGPFYSDLAVAVADTCQVERQFFCGFADDGK